MASFKLKRGGVMPVLRSSSDAIKKRRKNIRRWIRLVTFVSSATFILYNCFAPIVISMHPPPASTVSSTLEKDDFGVVPSFMHGRTVESTLNTKVWLKSVKAADDHEISPDEDRWIMSDKLLTTVRNHEAIIFEQDGGRRQTMVTTLGRDNRSVQWIDLITGEQKSLITDGNDPAGMPLNDLNHVVAVIVDTLDGTSKEIWLPCGFHNDQVNEEISSSYARIIDVKDMKVRAGPKLPFSGGACVALPVEVNGPGTPPHICSFGGTDGGHSTGKFMPETACYDRQRQTWHFPFGKLPFGVDHGNGMVVPAGLCHPDDPSRVLILNYRKQHYADQDAKILAYDIPPGGWSQDELARMGTPGRPSGGWYVYADFHSLQDVETPRDAAGIAIANGGRYLLQFGGVSDVKTFRQRFNLIRKFDVCEKTWTVAGDFGVGLFAVQTAASSALNVAITCGGHLPGFRNSPYCTVNRFPKDDIKLENHRLAAISGFPKDFVLGMDSGVL